MTITKAEAALLADYIYDTFHSALKYELCEFDLDWNAKMMFVYDKLLKATEPEPEPKPEPAAEKKPAANRKYDRGKVLALRQAGWTIKNIADELKCTEQTVRNILKDERDNVTNLQ